MFASTRGRGDPRGCCIKGGGQAYAALLEHEKLDDVEHENEGTQLLDAESKGCEHFEVANDEEEKSFQNQLPLMRRAQRLQRFTHRRRSLLEAKKCNSSMQNPKGANISI